MTDRLTFANVMSCVAVFIALGGSAIAIKANSVGSRQVKNGTLKSVDIKDGNLRGSDLAEETVTGAEVSEETLALGALVNISDGGGVCNPSSLEFTQCGISSVTVPGGGRVLLLVGGSQHGDADSSGSCKAQVGDQTFLDTAPVQVGDSTARGFDKPNGFAFTAASDPSDLYEGGSEPVVVLCNETAGDVKFSTTFSVIALSAREG